MGYIPTMPYAPIIPAVILGLLFPLACQAQAPAPAPVPEAKTMAENQLEAATIKVRLMKQIAASIDQDVKMLNQEFKLEGNYYKDFSDPAKFLVRLQLKLVGLGDSGSTMLQVSDGKVLWDFQKALNRQSFRKKDIVPIMAKLESSELDIYKKAMVISNLGFGGPEAMMSGLSRAVKFDLVAPDTLDGVEVWVISGKWIDRNNVRGLNDRPLAPGAPLPPYVPSEIKVYLGKENGWPYKIVMQGEDLPPSIAAEDTRATDPVSGRPVGVRKPPPKVEKTYITLLYKLLPISDIKPGLFSFNPPADVAPASVIDETEPFLAQLDLFIQSESTKKKMEAAKAAEEPMIRGTLEVRPPQDANAPDTFPTTPAQPTTPAPANPAKPK